MNLDSMTFNELLDHAYMGDNPLARELVRRFDQEVAERQDELDDLQKDVDRLNRYVNERDDEIRRLNGEAEELQNDLDRAEHKVSTLENRIDDLEAELEEARQNA